MGNNETNDIIHMGKRGVSVLLRQLTKILKTNRYVKEEPDSVHPLRIEDHWMEMAIIT